MGKFRIRVRLQGFELEVDGDREDIPSLSAAVQKQLGGLIQAPTGEEDSHLPGSPLPANTIEAADYKSRKPRKRPNNPRPTVDQPTGAIEFRHDSGKFGSPKQSWTVVQKCIWLLWVLEHLTGGKEFGASQLTATYNSQFKAAGKLHPPHIPRELSAAKVSTPAPVGEDKGQWFLTDEGKHQAAALVKEGLGG